MDKFERDRYERIDKILSNMGYGTRSEVKKLIRAGAVVTDGVTVRDGGVKVLPDQSAITVDGVPLKYKKYIYLMLNKPKGYVSATRDSGKKTVADLVPEEYSHYNLFPVGRLDYDTEGLLLLTNDGEFAHKALSPKKRVEKKYFAILDKPVDRLVIQAFDEGLTIDGGYVCSPAGLSILNKSGTEIEIVITEGKYHQIKRMFQVFGIKVVYLKRTEFAGLKLDGKLTVGSVRELSAEELDICKQVI